jgi:hypothetical protein
MVCSFAYLKSNIHNIAHQALHSDGQCSTRARFKVF